MAAPQFGQLPKKKQGEFGCCYALHLDRHLALMWGLACYPKGCALTLPACSISDMKQISGVDMFRCCSKQAICCG